MICVAEIEIISEVTMTQLQVSLDIYLILDRTYKYTKNLDSVYKTRHL